MPPRPPRRRTRTADEMEQEGEAKVERRPAGALSLNGPWTFAVDPGKTQAGVALFEGRRLVMARCVKAENTFRLGVEIQKVWWLAKEVFCIPKQGPHSVVVEGQQVYRGPSRSDPNDLIPLAYLTGAVFSRLEDRDQTQFHPLPREWKGSVPKPVHHRRILATLARVDPEGLKVVESLHLPKSDLKEPLDAIGLGLWSLGIKVSDPDPLLDVV